MAQKLAVGRNVLYTPGLKDHHMRNQGRTEIPAIVTGIVDEEKKVVNLFCFPDLANPDARGGVPHYSSSPDTSEWLGSWRFFDENTAEENADHTPILQEGINVEEFPGKQSPGLAYGVDPYATGDENKEPAKVVALEEQKEQKQSQDISQAPSSATNGAISPDQDQNSTSSNDAKEAKEVKDGMFKGFNELKNDPDATYYGPSVDDPNALKAGSGAGASSGEQLGEQKEVGEQGPTDEVKEDQPIAENLPAENQNASVAESAPKDESKPQSQE